jgi:hypothetical protein
MERILAPIKQTPPIFVTKDREKPLIRSNELINEPIPNDIIPIDCKTLTKVSRLSV